MLTWKTHYNRWINEEGLEKTFHDELLEMTDQAQLEEHFHTYLQFGTAGIRGILGPGTNRLNIYIVRKAAAGLAEYILEQGEGAKQRGVVIAYDNRHQSPEFAIEVAKTLGYHGIQSYVFESLRTTPELSFAIRHLKTAAGIMITASHNPPEYNGLKIYGDDGGQVTSEVGEAIVKKVNGVENELIVPVADEGDLETSGLLKKIGSEVDEAYLEHLLSVNLDQALIDRMGSDVKIVFTPFHGTGLRPVREGLRRAGFSQVEVVKEQAVPDPDFSTVKSPNPEEHAAFELAIEQGKKMDADLLIGTDPDADRMGVAVKFPKGEYGVLTGNQIGAIIFHYLLHKRKEAGTLPDNGVMLKSIVTSDLGKSIAENFKVDTIDVLTGFKYISEKIEEFSHTGEKEFLFGYEESYGYLIEDFTRDKDGVQACLFIAEVAAYYKEKGLNLYDGLMEIFKEYGYYKEHIESLRMEGIEGAYKITEILSDLRKNPPLEIAGEKVVVFEDYKSKKRKKVALDKEEEIELPQANVLKWTLADGSWVCARPSGTEPLIKFYFGVKADSLGASEEQLSKLKDAMLKKAMESN